jgi:hypothetical protein
MKSEAFDAITDYIAHNGMTGKYWQEEMCQLLFNTTFKFSTEQECYDYIHNDLKSFVELMKYVVEQNEGFDTKFESDVVKIFNLAWYYVGADEAMKFEDEPDSED